MFSDAHLRSILLSMADDGTDRHDDQRDDDAANEASVLCHRCGCGLELGDGRFWIVRIDAVCDPSPPRVDHDEPLKSLAADYEMLLAEMSQMSERELMDQVHRRMVLHLCAACFQKWYDDPLA